MSDGKNSDFIIRKKTVAVAFFVLIMLIAGAFFTGMFLGLNSKPAHMSYAEEDVFRERFDACSYKVQLLTEKLTTLIEKMKKLGLLNEYGSFSDKIFCGNDSDSFPDADIDLTEPVETKKVDDLLPLEKSKKKKENKISTTKKKFVTKGSKIKNREIDMLDRIMSELEEFDSKNKKIKKKRVVLNEEKSDANMKDEVLPEKCLYTLQFFSSKSRGDSENALKLYSSFRKSVLVEGVAKGNRWFRVRSGCYKTIDEAKSDLENVKKRIPNATVMRNR